MIEENKITLMGDEIAYGTPSKIKAFCRSTDVVVPVLSALFLVAQELVCNPGCDLGTLVSPGLLLVGSLIALQKAIKLRERDALAASGKGPKKLDRLWINTKPDKRAIDASQAVWMSNAERITGRQTRGIAVTGLMAASTTTLMGVCGAPALAAISTGFVWFLCFGACYIEGRHRWNKVAKGEWIVEDREPPRRRVPVAVRGEKKRFGFLIPAYGV